MGRMTRYCKTGGPALLGVVAAAGAAALLRIARGFFGSVLP